MMMDNLSGAHEAEDSADLVRSVAISSAHLWEEVLERLVRVESSQAQLTQAMARLQGELASGAYMASIGPATATPELHSGTPQPTGTGPEDLTPPPPGPGTEMKEPLLTQPGSSEDEKRAPTPPGSAATPPPPPPGFEPETAATTAETPEPHFHVPDLMEAEYVPPGGDLNASGGTTVNAEVLHRGDHAAAAGDDADAAAGGHSGGTVDDLLSREFADDEELPPPPPEFAASGEPPLPPPPSNFVLSEEALLPPPPEFAAGGEPTATPGPDADGTPPPPPGFSTRDFMGDRAIGNTGEVEHTDEEVDPYAEDGSVYQTVGPPITKSDRKKAALGNPQIPEDLFVRARHKRKAR
jgi:hypothetical protein